MTEEEEETTASCGRLSAPTQGPMTFDIYFYVCVRISRQDYPFPSSSSLICAPILCCRPCYYLDFSFLPVETSDIVLSITLWRYCSALAHTNRQQKINNNKYFVLFCFVVCVWETSCAVETKIHSQLSFRLGGWFLIKTNDENMVERRRQLLR